MTRLLSILIALAIAGPACAQLYSEDHHWTLDDDTGSAAVGAVSLSWQGTAPTEVAGKFGGALDLDGGDWGTTSIGIDTLSSGFAFSVWAESTTDGVIALFSDGDVDDVSMFVDADQRIVLQLGGTVIGTSAIRTASGVFDIDGQFHHVACTWSGSVATIYYDGVAVVSDSSMTTTFSAANDWWLGGGSSIFWVGSLDDARLWVADSLSASEVNSLYHWDEADERFEYPDAGSYTWSRPDAWTLADVECWGAGGGGQSPQIFVANGGGGGAYATSEIDVSSTATYPLTTGAGGTGGTGGNTGQDAGDTNFSANTVLAKGGEGGGTTGDSEGGRADQSIGMTKFAGGNGAKDGTELDGDHVGQGGGSSASESAVGNNGSGQLGGSAPATLAGDGGDGGASTPTAGASGTHPGGGGGGGGYGSFTTSNGGDGADGLVLISDASPVVASGTVRRWKAQHGQ